MSFSEFGKQRDNFEFIKAFNQKNQNQPTVWLKDLTNKHQDAIQINKGWLWQMFDSEQCEDADDNNYEFLASNE